MSEYRTTTDNLALLLFPFELPADFLERIGYPGTDALVGMYGRGDVGPPVLYDRGHLWPSCHDPRPWLDFVQQGRVMHWLAEYYVSLGTADPNELPTHHLVVIRAADLGFLAPAAVAIRMVQRQRKS